MDVMTRLEVFKDGLESAVKRIKLLKTDEDRLLHKEQMKFIERQFVILKKEIDEFIEREKVVCG